MNNDLDLLKQIGKRVKNIRTEMNVSKEILGEKIGVSGQFLGVVENGKSAMSYEKLKRLCEISGYSADYILFGKQANFMEKTKELMQNFSLEQIQTVCEIIQKMANIISKDENVQNNDNITENMTV